MVAAIFLTGPEYAEGFPFSHHNTLPGAVWQQFQHSACSLWILVSREVIHLQHLPLADEKFSSYCHVGLRDLKIQTVATTLLEKATDDRRWFVNRANAAF